MPDYPINPWTVRWLNQLIPIEAFNLKGKKKKAVTELRESTSAHNSTYTYKHTLPLE